MLFVGSYHHSLDAKKRIFIPAKFREGLGCEFYICRKFDAYLSVYTAADWEKYVETISALPESDAAELQDYLLGSAQHCVPDASGRIILDDKLLRFAKIDKNVVFVGAGHQVRIWAEEIWDAHEEELDGSDRIRQAMRKYNL